jgi:hypothetical protein
MAIVYLISPSELKTRTVISDNVDEKLLQQAILTCQDMQVLPIVGTALMNELYTQVSANSLTAANITLLEYIQKGMRPWIQGELVRPLARRFENAGMMENFTDHSRGASERSIIADEAHYRERAEFYANKTVLFLQQNKDTYPLYELPGDNIDTVRPQGEEFYYGLTFGDLKDVREKF